MSIFASLFKKIDKKPVFNNNITQSDAKVQNNKNNTNSANINPNKQNSTGTENATFLMPEKNKVKIIPVIFALLTVIVLLIVGIVFKRLKKEDVQSPSTKNEIVWWGIWNDENIYKPLIDEYQQKNPGTVIKYIKQNPQDYRARLVSSLNKKQGPDVFMMHNTWVPMMLDYLDKMPQSVLSSKDFTDAYYPSIVRDLNILNDFYGVPMEFDALTLYINEDIFALAGKTPPETWDELKETSLILTVKDKNKILQSGVGLGETKNVDYWPEVIATLILQNGVDLGNLADKSRAATDAFLYYKQFIDRNTQTWNDTLPPTTKAFAQGKLAMFFGPAKAAEEIIKENPKFRYRTYPLPQVRKDDPAFPDMSYATYWVQGVWVNSVKKGAGWDFLKFLMQKESLVKINQNILGSGKRVQFIYPRTDMAPLQIEDPILGSIVALAPYAKSWYLVSNTYDGDLGLNTQLNKTYETIIASLRSGSREPHVVVSNLSQKIPQILAQYEATIR